MKTWTVQCGFCHSPRTLYYRDDLGGHDFAKHKRDWMDAIGWDAATIRKNDIRPEVWRCDSCTKAGIGYPYEPTREAPPQNKED